MTTGSPLMDCNYYKMLTSTCDSGFISICNQTGNCQPH